MCVGGLRLLFLEEVAEAFSEYLGSAEPQGTEINGGGKEYADEEQPEEAVYPAGGKECGDHGGCCDEQEGEHVFQCRQKGIADFLIKEPVPDACPEDDDGCIGDNHVGNVTAKGMDDEDKAKDGATLGDDVPHIDVGLSA